MFQRAIITDEVSQDPSEAIRLGRRFGLSGHRLKILVGCGAGSALLLCSVQLEGKRRLEATDFLKGQPLPPGAVLGR